MLFWTNSGQTCTWTISGHSLDLYFLADETDKMLDRLWTIIGYGQTLDILWTPIACLTK